MKSSIKKDKKTGRDFYILEMGVDLSTGKNVKKKKRILILRRKLIPEWIGHSLNPNYIR